MEWNIWFSRVNLLRAIKSLVIVVDIMTLKLYFLRTNHSTAGPSQYRKLNRETTQDPT